VMGDERSETPLLFLPYASTQTVPASARILRI